MEQLSVDRPGPPIPIPPQVMQELQNLDPKYRKRVTFFGGHPISMSKKQYETIFSQINNDRRGPYSPYLVCQKTDGVRYLLIITNQGSYFVSREGSKNLVAYQASCKVSNLWKSRTNEQFERIVHLLDGEMVKDTKPREKLRYLIFDALICFRENIIKKPLKYRLNRINKFNQCNKYLLETLTQPNTNPIDIIVKDFFRLSCNTYTSSQILKQRNVPPPTTVEFLLQNYIKCLPHENDGLVFNHEDKQYILGGNPGYVKWKPPELNTVDFLIVPNTNLEEKFGGTVLDLYLGEKDDENIYRKLFYSFAVVENVDFKYLLEKEEEMYKNALENQQNSEITDEFFGLIAQCKFEPTKAFEQQIFKELYSRDRSVEEIREDIMKKGMESKELQTLNKLKNEAYVKSWKIYRIRQDKNMPNHHTSAKKIEDSIKDDIRAEGIIKSNKILNEKIQVSLKKL